MCVLFIFVYSIKFVHIRSYHGKFRLMNFEVTLSISLAMLLYTSLQLHPNAADAWNWQWEHRTQISDFPQVF